MILLETQDRRTALETGYASHCRDRIGSSSQIRRDKVNAIRRAIADGTYVTPAKLAVALERLIAELRSGL
jgi:anti-sigma28 factor (negative regulator of flagellin synthesis)